MSTRTGVYSGRTAQERQAARRERLVGAALEIWGEQGWAAVTMRGVCARAGLVDRYFYESFADREDLLEAVWIQVRDELAALVTATVAETGHLGPRAALRAVARAVIRLFDTDPQRTRIVLGDHAGSPRLEQRRRESLQLFTEMLVQFARPHLRPGVDELALRMSTLTGVGGFVELVTAWTAGLVQTDADQLADHATADGLALAERFLELG